MIVGEHDIGAVGQKKVYEVECIQIREDFMGRGQSEPGEIPGGPKYFLWRDIAVLTLKNTMEFDKNVQPVCVMDKAMEDKHITKATPAPSLTISGWGLTEEDPPTASYNILKKADIPFLHLGEQNKEKCMWQEADFGTRLCAGKLNDGDRAGACVGDIGGEYVRIAKPIFH